MNSILHNKQFLDAFQEKIIHVIAPASGTSLEKMQQLQALSAVLPLKIPATLLSDDIPYHANTDENRLELLKAALLNEDKNTLIWTLRGGYGSARLLDTLKELPTPKQQKTVIGFSDNTALLLFLSQQWHWPVIHGSVLTQLLDPKQDPENFLRVAEVIRGNKTEQAMSPLKPLNTLAEEINDVSGPITGGNLTLIENSIGTHWEVQTDGRILFLEETGEKGYRIDRSLTHLFQAGLLKNLKAIIFGNCSESSDEANIHFALKRFAEDVQSHGIPVYKAERFGHENTNWPIMYQAPTRILRENDKKSATLRMQINHTI